MIRTRVAKSKRDEYNSEYGNVSAIDIHILFDASEDDLSHLKNKEINKSLKKIYEHCEKMNLSFLSYLDELLYEEGKML